MIAEGDAFCSGSFSHARLLGPGWKEWSDVQSGVAGIGGDQQSGINSLANEVGHYLMALAVDLSSAAEIAVEMSIDDESQHVACSVAGGCQSINERRLIA